MSKKLNKPQKKRKPQKRFTLNEVRKMIFKLDDYYQYPIRTPDGDILFKNVETKEGFYTKELILHLSKEIRKRKV